MQNIVTVNNVATHIMPGVQPQARTIAQPAYIYMYTCTSDEIWEKAEISGHGTLNVTEHLQILLAGLQVLPMNNTSFNHSLN